jgi:nitroimidazol reductase NimA-like FMN-containing flavoprotein (pyridoxamine 5'-phosphate oxidase superfamily)
MPDDHSATDALGVTPRSRLKRAHERGHFDRATINAVLDAQPVCNVGYVLDGAPVVTPTLQWREGNTVYWHGSSASRLIRQSEANPVCLTVTLIDGLVVARSAMHHSANFRSVMLFGEAEKVTDPDEKEARLKTFVDGLFPGRWDTLRPMTAQERKATTVLSIPIEEGAAKIRSGPPKDDEDDYDLPIWAGVVPVTTVLGDPVPDARNLPGVAVPADVRNVRFGG